MRLLVCGSRDWNDTPIVHMILSGFHVPGSHVVIIEGGCPTGADKFARDWAGTRSDVTHEQYPADWGVHGRAAGPMRNQQMIDEGKPDVCVAFSDYLPASRGTADMVRRAKKAGIPTYVIGRA